jgi:hypothetical protein
MDSKTIETINVGYHNNECFFVPELQKNIKGEEHFHLQKRERHSLLFKIPMIISKIYFVTQHFCGIQSNQLFRFERTRTVKIFLIVSISFGKKITKEINIIDTFMNKFQKNMENSNNIFRLIIKFLT